MTLGQRIQELRKKHSLSQEALGEALGVSRQAISKWEGDLTIPELDKLIAMSKLFAIPVGQLLGVEQPPQEGQLEEGQGESAQPGELTPRELELVEAIVHGYDAQAQAGRRRRAGRRLVLGCGAGALVLAGLAVAFASILGRLDQLDGLNSRLNQTQRQLDEMSGYVDHQISYATQKMEQLLEQQNSLVDHWSYTIENLLAGGRSQIAVSVIPKEFRLGMTAQLSLTPWGRGTILVQGEWDGMAFQFPATLPAQAEQVAVVVAFVQGDEGQQQSQSLGELEDLQQLSQLNLDVTAENISFGWEGKQANVTGSYDVNFTAVVSRENDKLNLKPQWFQLRLYKNGTVLQRWDVPIQEGSWPGAYVGQMLCQYETLLEQAADEYVLGYCMQDNYGQLYQGELYAFEATQINGQLSAVERPVTAPAEIR